MEDERESGRGPGRGRRRCSALAGSAWAQAAKPAKIAVAVMDFDYGTVGYHWWGQYDIGKGMADQVVDALLNDGVVPRHRAQEAGHGARRAGLRARATAPIRARPSCRRWARCWASATSSPAPSPSSAARRRTTAAARSATGKIGGLGLKKAKTEVNLTARLIDTTTGEILVSAKGDGRLQEGRRRCPSAARRRRRRRVQHELQRLQGQRHRRGPGPRPARSWWPSSWPRRTSSSSLSLRLDRRTKGSPPRAAALFALPCGTPRRTRRPVMSTPVFTVANQLTILRMALVAAAGRAGPHAARCSGRWSSSWWRGSPTCWTASSRAGASSRRRWGPCSTRWRTRSC